MKKIGVISLGCDKNRVDTEKMLSVLSREFELTPDPEQAQIIIVNTCAFLEAARREAIDEILAAAELKKTGSLEKLIVTGCLPQKFGAELFEELVEADAILGVSDYTRLPEAIAAIYQGQRVNFVGIPRGEPCTDRVLTTGGYAYLKIADGCSNHCTYCLIPSIRGAYRSVPEADLIEETKKLGDVKELILVAQDVTKYGADSGTTDIVSLIKKLSALESVGGIRLLYCYPENITDALIDELASNPKLIKYIDVPLQHADDGVLKLMNRKGSFDGYLALIDKLKSRVPDIAIRSTFIAGFPGEDDAAFARLKDFIQRAELFNAGFFAYSREEGTPAYKMKNQVPEEIKQSRVSELYALQKRVADKLLSAFVGQTVEVIVEDFDGVCWTGRAYFNAPSIDGKVYFTGLGDLISGDKVHIKVLSAEDYDLYGELI